MPHSLTSLPLGVFIRVLEHLGVYEMNLLMKTCHMINSMTRRTFYKTIYISCPYSIRGRTPAIVDLLCQRADILPLIQYLVLDELEEESYRRLMSFDMPNLRSIEIWHEGPIYDSIDADKKQILNRKLLAKPKLENLSFGINLRAYDAWRRPDLVGELFLITPADAPLLYNPSLNRLRIRYADLTSLGGPLVEPFPFENLKTLCIETCHYSKEALRKLLLRAKSLENFIIRHTVGGISFDPCEFSSLLWMFRNRLKILELCWTSDSIPDLRIASFSALRYLVVSKNALFGSYDGESNFSRLIKQRVPPNLKILHLHGLSSNPPTVSREDPKPQLALADRLLLEALVTSTNVLPHLRYVIWADAMAIARSEDLEVLAAQNGVIMMGVTERYCTDPDHKWLDKTLPLEKSIEEASKAVARYWQK